MRGRFKGTAVFSEYMERKCREGAENVRLLRDAPAGTALGRLRDAAERLQRNDPSLSFENAFSMALLNAPHEYQRYLEDAGKD
jgi:hypothetical protein